MPRIPVSEKVGPVRYESNAVYMRGAPDANFGMESARSLARLGESIRQSGMQAGQAGLQISSAMKEYQRRSQEVSDQLNATEVENIFYEEHGRVDLMMKENPNNYDQFKIWAEEADTQYVARAGEYLEKMSPKFRAQFEAKMQRLRAAETRRREGLGIQAHVTAQQNLFLSQWKRAAEANRIDECFEMLKKQNGNLISEEKYLQLYEETLHYADFGNAKRAIESGDFSVIDALKERDQAGNYKNFNRLTIEERERFVRVAEAKESQKFSDELVELVERMNSNNPATRKEIEEKYKGVADPRVLKHKQEQLAIIDKFENRNAGLKRKATEEQKRVKVNKHEWQLYTHEFPPDPALALKQYNDLKREIYSEYSGDTDTVKKLMSQLDSVYNAKFGTGTGDKDYKNSYIYQKANQMLDKKKDSFFNKKDQDNWWNKYFDENDNRKDRLDLNFQQVKLELDHYIQNHPKASEKDVEEFLNKLKVEVNSVECKNIASFWAKKRAQRNVSKSGPAVSGSNVGSGTEVVRYLRNGRRAVFNSATKEFIRYVDDTNPKKMR